MIIAVVPPVKPERAEGEASPCYISPRCASGHIFYPSNHGLLRVVDAVTHDQTRGWPLLRASIAETLEAGDDPNDTVVKNRKSIQLIFVEQENRAVRSSKPLFRGQDFYSLKFPKE